MQSEKRSILSSATLVAGLMLLSRILGVIRDGVVARILGARVYNDIFNIAFQIPNLARRVLGEGALSAFIVPIYHREEQLGGAERAFLFFNRALTAMILLGGVLTVAGIFAAQPLFLIFGGLKYAVVDQPEYADYMVLGTRLTRIMFPFLLILTITSLFMGVCHAHRRFVTASLGSSTLNIVIIGAALLAWRTGNLGASGLDAAAIDREQAQFTVWLAWAVIGGVSLRIVLMAPTLWGLGWRFRPTFHLRDRAMGDLFRKMGVATFAAGVAQINISINLLLANWCGEGAVTYLYYSNRLIQFPLALVGSGLATALAPAISKHYVAGNLKEAHDLTSFTMRTLMIFTVPAMIGFWALGEPILAMIFQGGEWGPEATRNTNWALAMYATGLLPLAALRVLIPVFYAKGDVKTPVQVAAGALVVNVAANLVLMRTPLSYAGLALGASLSSLFNAWVLWRLLRREIGALWDGAMTQAILRCLVAGVIMGLACLGGWALWEWVFPPDGGLMMRAARAVTLSSLGMAVYCAAALALGLEEFRQGARLLARKRAK